MNEPAFRLEEQIINLFSNLETELYQGWVLRQTFRKTVVYPLYGASLSKQDMYTNYYLASLLEDNGYKRHCHIIAEQYVNEWFDTPNHKESKAGRERKMVLNKMAGTNIAEKVVTNNGSIIGIMRHELLYLPNVKL